MAVIDLTEIKARVNDVKTNIFYGDEESLKIYQGNNLLLELFEGFYIRPRPTTNLAIGAEYIDGSISNPGLDDSINLNAILNIATEFELRGVRYKITSYERPRSETQEWKFRLETTGKGIR